MNRNPLRWMAAPALVMAGLAACESESVLEGDPTGPTPAVQFLPGGTAESAIHGGTLPLSVMASNESVGVDAITVEFSGSMTGSFTRQFAGSPFQARLDTILDVPLGVEGAILFEAFGLNENGASVTPARLTVQVVQEDTIRPAVSFDSLELPDRAELGDTVTVSVQATDEAFGSGLDRVGAAVRVNGQIVSRSVTVTGQSSATRDIRIPVSAISSMPGAFDIEYFAWAVDQAGNCIVTGADEVTAACELSGSTLSFDALAGDARRFYITDTRSFAAVQSSNRVGDIVVDVPRRRLYYSNQEDNAVEALAWTGNSLDFVSRAFVGAQPWGMAIDNTGDTLVVANSGGTNLSYVRLNGASVSESRRYETPNNTLWQLSPTDGGWVLSHLGFSDRPQHVAFDATGAMLYSTTPTGAAANGTVRLTRRANNWQQANTDLILWTDVIDQNGWVPGVSPAECYSAGPDDEPCVIAFVDSVRIHFESPTLGTQLRVYDHVPGFPGQVIADTGADFFQIKQNLQARGSDILLIRGEWDADEWFTNDTTFVESSGDRQWVTIGEGDASPGRVWMWGAMNQVRLFDREITEIVNLDDYVENASDRVTGVSINNNGLLQASRSADGVYFFTNPLRLLGSYTGTPVQGGMGVGLHPNAEYDGGNPDHNWAAVGSAEPEIILVDTRHFREIGRIPLVEPVGGVIRVVPRQTGDTPDIIGHIISVTRGGTIFWVPVRTTYLN